MKGFSLRKCVHSNCKVVSKTHGKNGLLRKNGLMGSQAWPTKKWEILVVKLMVGEWTSKWKLHNDNFVTTKWFLEICKVTFSNVQCPLHRWKGKVECKVKCCPSLYVSLLIWSTSNTRNEIVHHITTYRIWIPQFGWVLFYYKSILYACPHNKFDAHHGLNWPLI